LEREASTSVRLPAAIADVVSARVLAGDASDAHNTFDAPDAVAPASFDGFQVQGDTVAITLPPRAVATIRVAVAF
jgi:alpha-N-arabinofuranosidase